MAAVAACNGGPGASDTLPPTAPPPPSTSADVPTAGPSAVIATAAPSGAGARVAIHWEPDTALDPWEINAVAAAEGGWVGLGNCKVDGTVDEQCAVSITSADGRTWAAHGISGNHLADGYDIVRVGDRWLVLEGRVWTS